MLKRITMLVAVGLLLFLPATSYAGVNSNVATATVSLSVSSSITVSLGSNTIALTPDSSNYDNSTVPESVSVSWQLNNGMTLSLCDSWATSTALTGTNGNILATAITQAVDGGSATAFAATPSSCNGDPSGSEGLLISSVPITSGNVTGNASHNVVLSTSGSGLAPGSYSGTLSFQASAL